jgi:O6-methylguanine-DNA--protein-cysteine methyltransferase
MKQASKAEGAWMCVSYANKINILSVVFACVRVMTLHESILAVFSQ